jgi:hypothetical protein
MKTRVVMEKNVFWRDGILLTKVVIATPVALVSR